MRRDNIEFQKLNINFKKNEDLEKIQEYEGTKKWLGLDNNNSKDFFKGKEK